jgi:hypothetical protein
MNFFNHKLSYSEVISKNLFSKNYQILLVKVSSVKFHTTSYNDIIMDLKRVSFFGCATASHTLGGSKNTL